MVCKRLPFFVYLCGKNSIMEKYINENNLKKYIKDYKKDCDEHINMMIKNGASFELVTKVQGEKLAMDRLLEFIDRQ